jgi:hypothetical protein
VIVEMVASRQTRGFPVDDTAGKWPHNLSEEEKGKMRNWVRTNHLATIVSFLDGLSTYARVASLVTRRSVALRPLPTSDAMGTPELHEAHPTLQPSGRLARF